MAVVTDSRYGSILSGFRTNITSLDTTFQNIGNSTQFPLGNFQISICEGTNVGHIDINDHNDGTDSISRVSCSEGFDFATHEEIKHNMADVLEFILEGSSTTYQLRRSSTGVWEIAASVGTPASTTIDIHAEALDCTRTAPHDLGDVLVDDLNATTVTATGAVQGGSLTDGTATISGGDVTGAVNITASGTVQGGTLTDGTASINGGAISGATTITATGDIQGGTLTSNGDVTINGGNDLILTGDVGTMANPIGTLYYTNLNPLPSGMGISTDNRYFGGEYLAAGTDGGSYNTASGWLARNVGAVAAYAGAGTDVAVTAPTQLTVDTGSYYVEIVSLMNGVKRHKVRIFDSTGAAVLSGTSGTEAVGTTGYSKIGNAESHLRTHFSVAAPTVLEIQVQGEKTRLNDGLGRAGPAAFGNQEVFLHYNFLKTSM